MKKIKKFALGTITAITLFFSKIMAVGIDEPLLYGPPSEYVDPTAPDKVSGIAKFIWLPISLIVVIVIGILAYIGIKNKKK